MLELFREIARRRDRGETVAMATIVSSKRSTPRGVGARIMVAADGSIAGTIGGGCGEHQVCLAALDVIRSGNPKMVRVELTNEVASNEGAACGGVMEVFVEPIVGRDG
ncbi:MAG TPA: XdhC family protein [Chloroflexota bacterium]|nr:XdhC family protein [Chloroflexota bacterium]